MYHRSSKGIGHAWRASLQESVCLQIIEVVSKRASGHISMGAVKRKRKDEGNNHGTEDILIEPQFAAERLIEKNQADKKQRVSSSWLGNFLSQKRDLVVPIPPDCGLADDTYLREFSQQFPRIANQNSADSDDDSGGLSFKSVEVEIVSGILLVDVDEIDETPVAITSVKLKLYNLPYTMNVEKVCLFVSRAVSISNDCSIWSFDEFCVPCSHS